MRDRILFFVPCHQQVHTDTVTRPMRGACLLRPSVVPAKD